MSVLNFYTRGGQLTLHKLHLFTQICMTTVMLSFCVGLSVFALLFFVGTTPYQRTLYGASLYAEFSVNMSPNDPSRATQAFEFPNGDVREVSSQAILKSPHMLSHIAYVDRLCTQNLWKSLGAALFSTLLLIGFFTYSGTLKFKKKSERGTQLASPKQLKRMLKKSQELSDLQLGDLPLLKDKETSHMLITGTTGAGKTTCFHTLLPQIRKRPNRAIVVDTTGEFVSNYYREGQDLLLNLFDERSLQWSPWEDCLTQFHYDTLAAAIVPNSNAADPFWEEAARTLLASALEALAKQKELSTQKLYHLLVRSKLSDFSTFFQETDAATYTCAEAAKMTVSIRASLARHLRAFKFLTFTDQEYAQEGQPQRGFSIRKWVQQETPKDQWLFFSVRSDQRATLLPLVSGWLDTALNALMTLPQDSNQGYNRRLWFILDELPALQKLPSLETAMAECRKYGGCVLAGIQSFPQLSTRYGSNQAHTLLDLFNTKIFFRSTDPDTTSWISRVLGEVELTEQQETLSYGAHPLRDGVSLSPHTRTKLLVLPSEIAALKDLEAFVKFPGPYPVCKLRMQPKELLSIAPAFKPILER